MQNVVKGYRGLSYLLGLNLDMMFVMAVLTAALTVGGFLGLQMSAHP